MEEALQILVTEKFPLEEVWGDDDEDVKWSILEPCGIDGTLSTRDEKNRSLGSGRIPCSSLTVLSLIQYAFAVFLYASICVQLNVCMA